MLSITRFTKTLGKVKWVLVSCDGWQGIKKFLPPQERCTVLIVCSIVTMAFLCTSVDEGPRVCFSLIFVVLIVVYQPGKWLWWCQLTPHCHSRFVSQTHHLSHPLGHPSPLTTHSPPPLPGPFLLILWCFSSCPLGSVYLDSNIISMMMTFGFIQRYMLVSQTSSVTSGNLVFDWVWPTGITSQVLCQQRFISS